MRDHRISITHVIHKSLPHNITLSEDHIYRALETFPAGTAGVRFDCTILEPFFKQPAAQIALTLKTMLSHNLPQGVDAVTVCEGCLCFTLTSSPKKSFIYK